MQKKKKSPNGISGANGTQINKDNNIKKTIAKINKTKSWFFEKINKIDKLLATLIKKKRERMQINKIRKEKEKSQLTLQKYKGL